MLLSKVLDLDWNLHLTKNYSNKKRTFCVDSMLPKNKLFVLRLLCFEAAIDYVKNLFLLLRTIIFNKNPQAVKLFVLNLKPCYGFLLSHVSFVLMSL